MGEIDACASSPGATREHAPSSAERDVELPAEDSAGTNPQFFAIYKRSSSCRTLPRCCMLEDRRGPNPAAGRCDRNAGRLRNQGGGCAKKKRDQAGEIAREHFGSRA